MASNFPLHVGKGHDRGRVQIIPVKSGQTFIVGALLKLTSNEVEEAGADPTALVGIAYAPASLGLDSAGSYFDGGTGIPVFVPGPGTEFFIASATTPVFATHHGVLYGVVKSTNWLLDISETTAVPFKVSGVSLSPGREGFYVVPNMGYWTTSGIID